MSETTNDERGASGAVVWTGISWRSTDANNKRSAVSYDWHIENDFVLAENGYTKGHAYTEADAVRWVAEGVLP